MWKIGRPNGIVAKDTDKNVEYSLRIEKADVMLGLNETINWLVMAERVR